MASSGSSRGKGQTCDAHLWLLARHDFRQPVQSLGLLSQVLAGSRTDAERQTAAASIAQVARSLEEMVAGMTLVARLETGETQPAPQIVPLQRAVADALAILAGLAAHRARHLVAGSLDHSVAADPDLLASGLRGLALHALKFASSGDVGIEAHRRGGQVALTLDYRGQDPAMAVLDQAFVELPPVEPQGQPFVGLGLGLVSRLAVRMNGRLEVGAAGEGLQRLALVLPAAGE